MMMPCNLALAADTQRRHGEPTATLICFYTLFFFFVPSYCVVLSFVHRERVEEKLDETRGHAPGNPAEHNSFFFFFLS